MSKGSSESTHWVAGKGLRIIFKPMHRCLVIASGLSVHPSPKPPPVSVLTATAAGLDDDIKKIVSSETDANGKENLFTNTHRAIDHSFHTDEPASSVSD